VQVKACGRLIKRSLLSQVIVARHADHLPVHQEAKILGRQGVELPDHATPGRGNARSCSILYQRLKSFVLASKVVGNLDTPVKVLDRSLPQAREGRIWPYRGTGIIRRRCMTTPRPGSALGGEVSGRLSRTFAAYAYAYVFYDSFFTDAQRGLVEVGRRANARHHFHNTLGSHPAHMGAVFLLISLPYAVEKIARESGVRGAQLRLAGNTARGLCWRGCMRTGLRSGSSCCPRARQVRLVAYTLKNWAALARAIARMTAFPSTTTPPSGRCAASRCAVTTGRSSEATRAARPRRRYAVS
jgi:transposase